VALVFGVPFGVAMGVSVKLDGAGWFGAVFMATSGVPFGLSMAWWDARWRRDRRQLVADIPPELIPAARNAVSKREVPDDPAVREATARLAARNLAAATQRRLAKTVIGVALVVATIAAATHGSWWAALYGSSAALLLFQTWIAPRRLRRQIHRLRAGE
jgi:hypothetical protein